MKSIPWSLEDDERLRKLALSGLSVTEIAHELRRNRSSVHTRAAKLKIVMARDRKPHAGAATRWRHFNEWALGDYAQFCASRLQPALVKLHSLSRAGRVR
jgi:hypothetical protein